MKIGDAKGQKPIIETGPPLRNVRAIFGTEDSRLENDESPRRADRDGFGGRFAPRSRTVGIFLGKNGIA